MPTKEELYEEATRLDVQGRSTMDKGELEKAVAKAQRAEAKAQEQASAGDGDGDGDGPAQAGDPAAAQAEVEQGAADGAAQLEEQPSESEAATDHGETYAPETGYSGPSPEGDDQVVSIVEGAPQQPAYVAGPQAISREGVELGVLGNPDLETGTQPAGEGPPVVGPGEEDDA